MMPEIPNRQQLAEAVFSITNEKSFRQIALSVFRYQYFGNPVYRAYADAVGRSATVVTSLEDIPFLPIQFFKSQEVVTGRFEPATVFRSSGTTGAATSRHAVRDLALYEKSFRGCFTRFFGAPSRWCILGLLPSYLEQGASSLVYMVNDLVKESAHPKSGFYLHDHERLAATLQQTEAAGEPVLLFGVTYALLDFAESFGRPLQHTVIVETGGMKGRKREMAKSELYQLLRQAFSLPVIHSEYGMTELLSQAYAANGSYRCPPWMKVVLRDETDPFSLVHRTGAINVMDLANIDSCSFIATDDLGRFGHDGSFEVLGRIDNSDVRGCSQLVL